MSNEMKVILTEEQVHALSNIIGQNRQEEMPEKTGPYTINPENVLLVKKYLDSNFKKGQIENIGPDGFPAKVRIAGMLSSDGNILQNLGEMQMEDLLIEKFKNMFIDKIERQKFLHKVLQDRFNDKIGMFGIVSVNILK